MLAAQSIAILLACSIASAATYDEFGDAQPVLIQGYAESAMEPFISPDGQQLLFNTSNDPPGVPSLQLASRAKGGRMRGRIDGLAMVAYAEKPIVWNAG